ncbi:hypothetical protein BDV95DRAFT_563485 [Massariosphaeria phaeospora]|uniref:Uncharacterized protein n=1 Tax=Massariosphaeria phaeospora TaxID=100035 RepID=A0A7C8ICP8_9PLEO|nr:hypothetical protein BDV95DRAFT_563485 [Massariosphaeria phaeospora]
MDLNSLLTKIIYILCNLYIMWPHSTPEHLRYPGGRDGHPRKHQILSMIALSPFITVYGSFARNLFCYMLGGEGWLHAAYCTQVKIHTCFYLVWLLVAWVANWARISDPEYLRHYVARQRWLRRDVMRRQWTNRLSYIH